MRDPLSRRLLCGEEKSCVAIENVLQETFAEFILLVRGVLQIRRSPCGAESWSDCRNSGELGRSFTQQSGCNDFDRV